MNAFIFYLGRKVPQSKDKIAGVASLSLLFDYLSIFLKYYGGTMAGLTSLSLLQPAFIDRCHSFGMQ